jgi:hypothetical protein
LNNQKIFGVNENKKLSELCEFIKTGKNKPSDNKTGTLYPYYGTGSITGYTDEYLYDGCYILTARNGTIGNCFLTEGKFFPSDNIFVIDIKDKCLMKYVYYILSNNEKLDKLYELLEKQNQFQQNNIKLNSKEFKERPKNKNEWKMKELPNKIELIN